MEGGLVIRASLGRHLALAPVAFAVTEGPAHDLLYANTMFRRLQSAGEIGIGARGASDSMVPADLTPVLDRAFRSAETVRDVLLDPLDNQVMAWSCTVWPVPASISTPQRLVIEVRDIGLVEGAKARQRAIAERLLLGALREQD